MKRPIVVFDFDKTLTKRDTIFGFYKFVSASDLKFKIKFPFFFTLAVLAKINFISNYTLKKWGIWLYLKNSDREQLLDIGEKYASEIEMNRIYQEDFQQYNPQDVIIMSASFEEYLEPIFSGYRVAGSRILYSEDGSVQGLERNLYGSEKLHWLQEQGIQTIDILYTDSYSDRSLMEISNCVFMINNNKKSLIKGSRQ